MITVRKLQSLPPHTRLRKIIRLLDGFVRYGVPPDPPYLRALAGEAARTAASLARRTESAGALERVLEDPHDREQILRQIDALRYELRALCGEPVADWDLLSPAGYGASGPAQDAAPAAVPEEGDRIGASVSLYLESVRSPFNVGSIIRTAAAFGVRRVGLSSDCPPVDHPRVVRSAMGAGELVELVRLPLSALGDEWTPLIAVETGGTPVRAFTFPHRGTLLFGSEEFGLSRDALDAAAGRVSIALSGWKSSLNVGVACGIVLHQWFARSGRD